MSRVTAVLAVAVLIALALVASQLLLPGIAEQRVRDDLARSGDVERVDIHAFPALKLLFHRADRVTVRIGAARTGPGRFADLVAATRDTDRLDATADSLALGPLEVTGLRLRKDGPRVDGEAFVTAADLASALPLDVGIRPIASENGSLVLEASAGVLGAELAVRARLSARDGDLVIAPEGLFGGFATLTVFSDPRFDVTAVGARERGDGYTFTAAARLRS